MAIPQRFRVMGIAMMMKVKLRLYKYHDPELVEIYRIQSVNFEKLALSCLRAFVQKGNVHYEIRKEGTLRPAKRVHQVTLKIDESKDADVIKLLKKADDGCMNAFIKTILKWYLSSPMPSVLIKDKTDSTYFEDRYSSQLFGDNISIIGDVVEEVKPETALKKVTTEQKREPKKKEPVRAIDVVGKREAEIPEENNEEIEAFYAKETLSEKNSSDVEQGVASNQDIAQMFMTITQMSTTL